MSNSLTENFLNNRLANQETIEKILQLIKKVDSRNQQFNANLANLSESDYDKSFIYKLGRQRDEMKENLDQLDLAIDKLEKIAASHKEKQDVKKFKDQCSKQKLKFQGLMKQLSKTSFDSQIDVSNRASEMFDGGSFD